MYYFLPSFLWIAIFLGVVIYLNVKINRLSERVEKAIKSGTVKSAVPSAPVTPTLSGVGTTTQMPAMPSPAPAPTPAIPSVGEQSTKVDTEEKSGQWLGKIGIAAIVLGVSFFLKWAFDEGLIGPMGRVILGIVGGMALVVVGQLLRKKYQIYSDIVTGGGIAVLYLTLFAAYAFYNFIGSPAAMALMLVVTALSVTLSVIGGTQQLAVLGIVGGMATPALVSTGSDNFLQLMGYLIVLDLGILGVAVFRKWMRLNLLGFIGTALWFMVWFEHYYEPQALPKTFLVATVFFIIYLLAGVIHNVLWKKESKGEDLFLVTFNAAFYALAAYVILNPDYHGVMGFFMFFLAAFYFVLAFVTYRMNPGDKLLSVYLPGIAVVFLTLAMPIQFSGKWITLAWLLESVLLVAAGSTLRRHSMNIFGLVVFAVGLVRFFAFDAWISNLDKYTVIANSRFFLAAVAILAAYALGYMLMRHHGEGDEKGRREGAAALFILANLLSLFIVTAEISTVYRQKLSAMNTELADARAEYFNNGGFELSERSQDEFRAKEDAFYASERSVRNRRNTLISIAWALYATVLTAIGFGARRRLLRILGMALLFVTAFKVLIDVWQLGEVYRIVSSMSFGVIALLVSFAYAKWKHRLREVL